MSVRNLEPKAIWNNFENLNSVPRPSKQEERVRAFIRDFGNKLGLETLEDEAGNIVIKKPASSPAMEKRQTVILQAHLDMVHQKNNDTEFDFQTHGIQSYIDGDWVKAKGTTLGADNGMGVAAMMSVLESKEITHPAIEALFTIDEEAGMTGAQNLDGSMLSGTILLNLDTEDDDELCIGCAGGIDTNVSMDYNEIETPESAKAFLIEVKGLLGGHSGVDIHLGRGNANKLMVRLLYKMNEFSEMQIASFDGGGVRNAIPREASAQIIVLDEIHFEKEFNRRKNAILEEFKSIEPNIEINLKESDLPEKVMNLEVQEKMLNTLFTAPNGVFRWSPDIPDLVETSNSTARVLAKDGEFMAQCLSRSSIESGKEEIANAVRSAFELMGAIVENGGQYPGWKPNADSAILKSMNKLYEEMFNEKANVLACHAGLECGLIGERKSGLDMISFGPTIKHPHSPDEKVSISSVQKFWKFYLKVLEETPLA